MGCTSNKQQKGNKVVMFGLSKGGKTSILYQMARNIKREHYIPTLGLMEETFTYKKNVLNLIDFQHVDSSQFNQFRPNLVSARAIIFVIDGTDKNSLGEAQQYFESLLQEDNLKGLPILIFINKCDLNQQDFVSEEDIKRQFNLANLTQVNWTIQKCSASNKQGLNDGLHWIIDQFKLKKNNKPPQLDNQNQ